MEDKIESIKFYAVKFLQEAYIEMIYITLNTIFMIALNDLNHTLLSKFEVDKYFDIVFYSNAKPLIYFLITLMLIMFGAYLVVKRFKSLRLISDDDYTFKFVVSVMVFLMISIIIILLIHLIMIPIFKAIAVVTCVSIILLYSKN